MFRAALEQKMTLCRPHGRVLVHSTEVGAPMYRGVELYTISRGAEHNSESQQRYRNCRDLENFIWKSYEEEE